MQRPSDGKPITIVGLEHLPCDTLSALLVACISSKFSMVQRISRYGEAVCSRHALNEESRDDSLCHAKQWNIFDISSMSPPVPSAHAQCFSRSLPYVCWFYPNSSNICPALNLAQRRPPFSSHGGVRTAAANTYPMITIEGQGSLQAPIPARALPSAVLLPFLTQRLHLLYIFPSVWHLTCTSQPSLPYADCRLPIAHVNPVQSNN